MFGSRSVSFCVGVALCLGRFSGKFEGQGSTEPPWVQIERNTVRIEREVGANYVPDGTGFFVVNEEGSLFIVTARHVAFKAGNLRARVPSLVLATGKTGNADIRHARAVVDVG